MPTWSAWEGKYLSGRASTEIGAGEESLRLGEEVIVLEEYHISSLTVLSEEVLSLKALLVKGLNG